MFRKPSKKKKPSKIRKRVDDEDEEDEEQSLHDKIRNTQKKQKILSSLPLVTGNPSRKPAKKANDGPISENVTGEMSVMEKKQHQLMQEYIEEQMNKGKPQGGENANSDALKTEESAKHGGVTTEEELYQELAKEVYSMKQQQNQQVQEERGAVLVGGTGLAEVILPSNISDKKGDKSNKNRVYRRDGSSSAVPTSSTMANTTLTSAKPQFRSFQQHKTRANQPSQEEKDNATTDDPAETTAGDADRVGFNAYRGKPTEKKKLVKKQRDDSVFSDFVKHQRGKMMNRR